jgi:hypothetical protein
MVSLLSSIQTKPPQKENKLMLDIKDKKGKVIAVLLDDGTIVKRENATDDIDEIIRERLKKLGKESK